MPLATGRWRRTGVLGKFQWAFRSDPGRSVATTRIMRECSLRPHRRLVGPRAAVRRRRWSRWSCRGGGGEPSAPSTACCHRGREGVRKRRTRRYVTPFGTRTSRFSMCRWSTESEAWERQSWRDLDANEALIADVGDSRAYLVRAGPVLTVDRRPLACRRDGTDETAVPRNRPARHPARSQLTRSLGGEPAVKSSCREPSRCRTTSSCCAPTASGML